LGLLARSEAETGEEHTDKPLDLGDKGDDTETSSGGGNDFNGVASAELGTDGFNSVEENSVGKMTLDQGGEDRGADMPEEKAEQDAIAFDSVTLEDLGEETSETAKTADEKADDDLADLSLEVEDLEDSLEEEVDTVMSTPHAGDIQALGDDDETAIVKDRAGSGDEDEKHEDETLSDMGISTDDLVDPDSLPLEPLSEVSGLPPDMPAGDRPDGAPDGADVIELEIGEDELEIVSEGTKRGEEIGGEPEGVDLEDLDLTLVEDVEEKGEEQNLDDMDIDLDDTDTGHQKDRT
jgi:hypothetical protein